MLQSYECVLCRCGCLATRRRFPLRVQRGLGGRRACCAGHLSRSSTRASSNRQKAPQPFRKHEGFVSEGVCSVKVDIDEATAIYARACRVWYGKLAPRVVKDRLRELARRGDTSGVAAWTRAYPGVVESEGIPNG